MLASSILARVPSTTCLFGSLGFLDKISFNVVSQVGQNNYVLNKRTKARGSLTKREFGVN